MRKFLSDMYRYQSPEQVSLARPNLAECMSGSRQMECNNADATAFKDFRSECVVTRP